MNLEISELLWRQNNVSKQLYFEIDNNLSKLGFQVNHNRFFAYTPNKVWPDNDFGSYGWESDFDEAWTWPKLRRYHLFHNEQTVTNSKRLAPGIRRPLARSPGPGLFNGSWIHVQSKSRPWCDIILGRYHRIGWYQTR